MKTNPFLVIAGLSALIFIGCAKDKSTETYTEEVVCVKAKTLVETNAAFPVQCSGLLSSKRLIKLSFKTGGIIARINVDEGSPVKKGQVIASLEMTEIAAQVDQAKLALEKAERDLKRIKSLYSDTVATLEQLQEHPYISYQLAKVIIAYRNQHGGFRDVSDIRKVALMTPDLYSKLEPYLKAY